MKSKILIFSSFITLMALVAIQGYLVYNTYELKQKTMLIDARGIIAKVYNSPQIDSIAWLYRNDFSDNLRLYAKGATTKNELVDRLDTYCQQINPGFIEAFNKGLLEHTSHYGIKIQILANSITLTDSLGTVDSLYASTDSNLLLLGNSFDKSDGFLINNSTWQNEYDFEFENGERRLADLEFKTYVYMNISNGNNLIFREMTAILLLSAMLFLFVVGLLYYSIRNLLKQKRISEIKTDFINNITHELKTPLTTLSIGTKTLKVAQEKGDLNLIDESIEVIDRQNNRLQNLIDQVLKSSLGYNGIVLQKEEINASNFLNELLDDYSLTLNKEISLSRNIENTGVLMEVDSFYLGTAILNLLNNSIKYGGSELKVSYSLDLKEGNHKICIKDNGIGISEKYHKHIFDKFYRVGESYTHNYKGLGLGLYYTHQIVKAHQGSILLESQENEGATFIIKIPIKS